MLSRLFTQKEIYKDFKNKTFVLIGYSSGILFLLSSQSNYISGTTLIIDGEQI